MTAAISESVRSLNEAAQAMRDGQSKLVEVTSGIIEQMNRALGENSVRLREETDVAVRRVVEQIGEAAGGFSDKVGGAGAGVAAALLTTSNNLQNVVTQCQEIVTHTEATVQRFDGLVKSVSAATEDTLTAHAALRATAQPLQTIDLYAEKIRELNSGLDTHLSKGLSDLAGVVHELHETVEDLETAISTTASARARS
jgi:hypothetical protein